MPKIPQETKLSAGSLFADLDDQYSETFRGFPVPELVLLPARFQVYKWAGTSRLEKGARVRHALFNERGYSSAYWAPWAAMHTPHHVPGFAQLRKRYRNTGGSVGSPQAMARQRFAVTEEFSEMNSLVKAELLAPAYAFLGICGMMPFSNNSHNHRPGFLPGGDYQLVIPGLRVADIFKL